MTVVGSAATCPNCGAAHNPNALFCEECAFDFTGGRATNALVSGSAPPPAAETHLRHAVAATPVTAERGEESPLDVGWTGAVDRTRDRSLPIAPQSLRCTECGQGDYVDGYCDICGTKQRDPRDHFVEEPQPWVAGVCDIGRRHRRNEDAMALHAEPAPLSFAVLVVCDGVSNSTDSHIASLAASRAARNVLDDPVPRGMGTRTAIVSAIVKRLDDAVEAARRAVVDTTTDREVENPPSCTFVAALVDHGLAVVGNVGDSRAYWLPDDAGKPARQLSSDDSFAAEQMSAGMPRKQAETSAGAHAITRWLGSDSPDDLTPHTADLDLDEDGWLLVCSDGLWNYASEAEDLRRVVHDAVERLGDVGHHPASLAQALTDFANDSGGIDNITVSLARVGALSPPRGADTAYPDAAATPVPPAPALPLTHPPTGVDPADPGDDGKDTP